MSPDFRSAWKALLKAHSDGLWLTCLFAAGVAVSAVMLLGVSGWFLTAAAIAGGAGPIAAQAFNYLLPSALIRTLAISRTALRYAERLVGHSVALRAMAQLRPALFERILAAPPRVALSLSRGEASSRFVQDVATLENAIVMRSVPPAAVAGMLTAVALAALGGPFPALVLSAFMALCLWLCWRIHASPPAAESEAESVGAVKDRFSALLQVLPDIRTSDPGHGFLRELEQLEDRLVAARTATLSRDAVTVAVTTAMTGLCLPVMAWAGLKGDLAGLAMALLAATMGFESLASLVRSIGQRHNIAQAEERLSGLYDLGKDHETTSDHPYFEWRGSRFRLDGTLRLHIDGPSGSGKSQLIESVIGLGMSDCHSRQLVAWQPQDASVLTGSLRHNLGMAGETTEEALWAALHDACLADRVKGLPNGLDTWIGDGGVTLSGGERKRLALARAYLRPAPVLALDEPTEGLDRATEDRVVERLEKRLARTGQGLILVSHRESPRRLTTQRIDLGKVSASVE